MSHSPVREKSFEFALQVVEVYKVLRENREFVLARQLLRSGTSIGANIEEAIAGQSRRDFLSKMSVALKEARETRYWLSLLQHARLVDLDLESQLTKVEELIRLLSAIVKTTKGTPRAAAATR